MKLNNQRIIVQNDAERLECTKAAIYGSDSSSIYTGIHDLEFSAGTSYVVLRGLARLSLTESEIDFHGLTPQAAYQRISQLCGEPEDFVPETWAAKFD